VVYSTVELGWYSSMPLVLLGTAKSPPGSDSKLGTRKTHFLPYHVPTGNHFQQSLLGTKLQTRLFLQYGEGDNRQPSPKTRENGPVLCLLKLCCLVPSQLQICHRLRPLGIPWNPPYYHLPSLNRNFCPLYILTSLTNWAEMVNWMVMSTSTILTITSVCIADQRTTR